MFASVKVFCIQLYQKSVTDELDARAAALAFHATIALAPIMLLLFIIFGWLIEQELIQRQLQSYVLHAAGERVSDLLTAIFLTVEETGKTFAFSLIGLAIALFGTTNLFGQLQKALLTIFNLSFDESNIFKLSVIERIAAFMFMLILMLLIVFLLFLDLLFTDLLSGAHTVIVGSVSFLLSLCFLIALFTLVYRSATVWQLSWRGAFCGALVSAPLIVLGNALFSWIFAESATLELYGAVGSAIAFLLWMYFVAYSILLGAECVQWYKEMRTQKASSSISAQEAAVITSHP